MARKFDVETVLLVVTRIIAAGGKRGLSLSTKGTQEVLNDILRFSAGQLSNRDLRDGLLDWPTITNGIFSNYQGLAPDLVDDICREVGRTGGENEPG